jgi:NADH:ubiquinone oxidoreductase subunit E
MNAEAVQRYITEHHLEQEVGVNGCLCGDKCKNGPNVFVDGKIHSHFQPDMIGTLFAAKEPE